MYFSLPGRKPAYSSAYSWLLDTYCMYRSLKYMDKQIPKEFTVFLLNCEINSLLLKYVCLYEYINTLFHISQIVASFALLLPEQLFCIILQMASKILYGYSVLRKAFSSFIYLFLDECMYMHTHTHSCMSVIYLHPTDS